jgi:ribonucleotide monophosphatase NagD (HAD superfamily)
MIICDIDDTIVRAGQYPIQKTIDYVNSLNTRVIIVTGRERKDRSETEAILKKVGIKYSSLLMNPYSYRDSNKWKREAASKLHDATLAIDDNAGARKAYEAEGIKTIHPDDVPDMDKFWSVFETNSGY